MPIFPPTTGAPLSLYVPPFDYGVGPNDYTYDVPVNDNWEILNTFAARCVLIDPAASQTINQPVSSYLNVNAFLAYDGTVRFGTAADVWDGALSRIGAGSFTLDSNAVGNAAATLKLNILNAVTGLRINGAAPAGYILVGNGTNYVPSATIPPGTAFYQTVQLNAVSQTQRNALNFSSRFAASDSSSPSRTNIDLANTAVTPGSYTLPNFTVDAYGRITAAANGSLNRTTNSNGSYIQYPDGTIFAWGTATLVANSGVRQTVNITFPHAFTTTPNVTCMAQNTPRADQNDVCLVTPITVSTTAATLKGMCCQPTGGGGATFDQNVTVDWQAVGW